MKRDRILTVNAGSSTIKFGVFERDEPPRPLGRAKVDLGAGGSVLEVDAPGSTASMPLAASAADGLPALLDEVHRALGEHVDLDALGVVAHRVVHGGRRFTGPVVIDDATLQEIAALERLAPLHQPQSVRLIDALRRLLPHTVHTASFDTAFHHTQDALARRMAIPRSLHDEGVQRYGFHGLSYRHVADTLRADAPQLYAGRVVAAHLGNGASLCALQAGRSRDTSMGFSTLDGVMMGTRCGALDPGVVLYLLRERGMSREAVERMLYQECGLFGVSGESADVRVLQRSREAAAHEALELFAFQVARMAAALACTLGGLDGLVFTAGIGEHHPGIRAAICERLAWLGVRLDTQANAAHGPQLAAPDSTVRVLVIPADEERVIAEEAAHILSNPQARATA